MNMKPNSRGMTLPPKPIDPNHIIARVRLARGYVAWYDNANAMYYSIDGEREHDILYKYDRDVLIKAIQHGILEIVYGSIPYRHQSLGKNIKPPMPQKTVAPEPPKIEKEGDKNVEPVIEKKAEKTKMDTKKVDKAEKQVEEAKTEEVAPVEEKPKKRGRKKKTTEEK